MLEIEIIFVREFIWMFEVIIVFIEEIILLLDFLNIYMIRKSKENFFCVMSFLLAWVEKLLLQRKKDLKIVIYDHV